MKNLNQKLSEAEVDDTWIIATSRFEATPFAIRADSATNQLDFFAPGGFPDTSSISEDSEHVLTTGGLSVAGDFDEITISRGYMPYKLK